MRPRLACDMEETVRALRVLHETDEVIELRIPKTEREGTVSGYFADHAALAKQIGLRNGDAGIYVTLNPVVASLLARAANRVQTRARNATSDHDIARRRWLLIDCDPVRPAEISSTDAEHEAALECAREVRTMLSKDGWPVPVLADSGNGAHLLYRIELSNDEASARLVKALLKALATRFDRADVKVDQTVYNAARIVKAYGTVTRKGDDLIERPHRLSRILDVPTVIEPVQRELLEKMAAHAALPPAPPWADKKWARVFDLEGFLSQHLKASVPVAHEGGRKWVLEECPFNPDHKSPDAAIFQAADGTIGFKCFHNSCDSKDWDDVRELFKAHTSSPQSGESTRSTEPTDWPPTAPSWPDPIHEDGFHGIAGELVRIIEPHSEADPAALLVQTLVGWGSLAGRGPYYLAEADRHHTNEYADIVGTTAKSRKGTSYGRILNVLSAIDQHWAENRQIAGLGSGEALINALSGEDRRMLVIEGEFARLLAVLSREGSTISANLRTGWDTGTLSIITRQKKVKVSGAHLSLIGHITREELLRRLDSTETANGFGNRILWACARRSKALPHGGGDLTVSSDLLRRLQEATAFARKMGNTRVRFDSEAATLWEQVYGDLSEGRPGMLGSMTSRAEAHVVRLALIYALLDCSASIRVEHLRAALAVWRYCEASARYIWGDALGDPMADEILRALRAAADNGLTRWDISNHFGRNKPAREIDRGIGVLAERGLIRFAREETDGRASTRYWTI